MRLNADGSPDTTFGGDGVTSRAVATGSYLEFINAVAWAPGDKVVIAGYCYVNSSPSQRQFAFVRYNEDGTLDSAFDGDAGNTTAP